MDLFDDMGDLGLDRIVQIAEGGPEVGLDLLGVLAGQGPDVDLDGDRIGDDVGLDPAGDGVRAEGGVTAGVGVAGDVGR